MIVVIGSINLDLIATVERLPSPGETVPGNSFATAPGGKGANQALAARRAGADVRMIGAIGNDAFADEAVALLHDAGIDLSGVRKTSFPTGIAMILVGEGGENVIAVVPGSNGTLSAADVKASGIKRGDHVLAQLEIPLDAVSEVLTAARAAGAVTILNTAPFHAEATPLLERADIVIANETEFDLYARELGLAGDAREHKMLEFHQRTGHTIVVTLGAEGVVAADANGLIRAHGLTVDPVDTVGAGDTFCGYLAAALQDGLTLQVALLRAAVAGSLACLKPGAQPSIPTAAEVDAARAR